MFHLKAANQGGLLVAPLQNLRPAFLPKGLELDVALYGSMARRCSLKMERSTGCVLYV